MTHPLIAAGDIVESESVSADMPRVMNDRVYGPLPLDLRDPGVLRAQESADDGKRFGVEIGAALLIPGSQPSVRILVDMFRRCWSIESWVSGSPSWSLSYPMRTRFATRSGMGYPVLCCMPERAT
jgi:hypothetical protein